MKILLVEDNKSFANTIKASLEVIGGIQVEVAISSESANRAVAENFYDLIVLDLSIPQKDNELESASEYGQSVFYHAKEQAPRTPVRILTGSDPDKFTMKLVSYGESLDLWGANKSLPLIAYYPKEQADQLVAEIASLEKILAQTNDITIDTRGKKLAIPLEEQRIIKVFTRSSGGASCLLEQLGGGLSDSSVYRATVRNEKGNIQTISVAKLGSENAIQVERTAYEQHVKHLGLTNFTPLLHHVNFGVKRRAGIFYTLAEDYKNNFFQHVRDGQVTSEMFGALRGNFDRWSNAKTLHPVTVKDVRRGMLSDDDLLALSSKFDLGFLDGIEDKQLKAYQSCIHGDFHGGNVLINSQGKSVVIDLGDVGVGFSCQDPVSLELSLFFHPDAHEFGMGPKLSSKIGDWPIIDTYLNANSFAQVIDQCRQWAHDVGGSDAAVLAAGYAYVIRQLKYDTVQSDITLRVLQNIVVQLKEI